LDARKAEIRNSDAARQLDIAEAAIAHREDEAQERYNAAVSGLTNEGDMADELRRSRYAGRVHRQLADADGDGRKITVARRLIDDAKPSELSALIEELPTALPNIDWLPAKLKEVCPEVGSAAEDLRQQARSRRWSGTQSARCDEGLNAARRSLKRCSTD
jgi:hypothetical protein